MKKLALFLLLASVSFNSKSTRVTKMPVGKDNTLTEKERKEGWKLLFDGTSAKGWHSYGKTGITKSWKIEDGTVHLDTKKAEGSEREQADLITNNEFDNFHLSLDWKISQNGNSGVIFYVNDDPAKYKQTYETGPEMQVLDNNGHPDAKIHKHRAGDLYDLIASSKETVKPAGEWNHAEIISNKGKLELLLNGEKVVTTTLWNKNWQELVAASKFKSMPGFGIFKKGHIALQDHGDDVWYKNIKIKAL